MTDILDSHARKRDVPTLPGTRIAKCIVCRNWAAFPSRYRKCHPCQPTASARLRLEHAVAALERVNVKAPKAAKPKDQRTVGGLPLARAMAYVASLHIDFPNLKACDLRPEFRDLWPA